MTMFRIALAALLAAFLPLGAQANDKMTILLDWFVNPDHAPLIVAREKGFFAAVAWMLTWSRPPIPTTRPSWSPPGAPIWRCPISRSFMSRLPRDCH